MAENETIRVSTPVGRLINHALFERDAFKNGEPLYKIELALEDDDTLANLEEAIIDAAVEEWGEEAEQWYEQGKIKGPLLDGDELAEKRRERGKAGDAYEGKVVIRAHTKFNRHGEDGPGGVYVCGPDAVAIDFADRSRVYNGCYGIAVVTPVAGDYNGKYVTLYLAGFQLVKDGEQLRSSDPSSLFKPMMSSGSENKGRRKRGG